MGIALVLSWLIVKVRPVQNNDVQYYLAFTLSKGPDKML